MARLFDHSSERAQRRLLWTSARLRGLEARIATHVPVSANTLSAIKLFVLTPLVLLAMRQVDVLNGGPELVIGLVAAFFALDYLDGVVARANDSDTWFGRVFDRATDYPLLVAVSYFCVSAVPVVLLAVKLALDLLLFTLFILGRGTTENRVRMTMSCAALLGLLCLSQGWMSPVATASTVTVVLVCNIIFSAAVALRNLDVLAPRESLAGRCRR